MKKLIFYFLLFGIQLSFLDKLVKSDQLECSSSSVDNLRVDCFPENWATQNLCESRGCCWLAPLNKTNNLGVPYCFYPSNFKGYVISSKVIKGNDFIKLELKRDQPSGFSNDFDIFITLKAINKYRALITVEPQNQTRWKPPIQLDLDYELTSESERLYKLDFDDRFIKLIRQSNNRTIWKLNYRTLIFADQWLSAETHLPSLTLFGLGEYKDTYRKKIDEERKSYLFFSQGDPPNLNRPLYSSHPIYLTYENDEDIESKNNEQTVLAHTVLFLNSNAAEAVLSPGKILVWRSIGGQMDFYINLGSNPQEAVSRYVSLIGKPSLPPFWSLGFQLSRYGFNNLKTMKKVYNRMKENAIPLDVMWTDIDLYRDYNIFSVNNDTFDGLAEFIDLLHDEGVHYIPMLDPGLGGNYSEEEYPALHDGLNKNVFIRTENSNLLKTHVWNKYYTLWVDFTSKNATDFWIEQIGKFHDEFEFDGLWIDMNSPDANGIDGSLDGCNWENKYEKPYFVPIGLEPLTRNTACMNSKHELGIHYDIHNMYSYFEVKATNLALKRLKKRPFIISRSSFVGHGRFGAKWTGDVSSVWEDLRVSISNMLSFNIFGIPVVGADICGFLGNTNDELCARWQSLGAFYTFSRNHNDLPSIDQDPPSLGELVVNATKYSLNIRYSLLPLFYTELYRSSQDGRPVVKALSLVFPNDKLTYDIESQFLLGDSIMIIPIIEQGKIQRSAYLPKGIWYDFIKQTIVSNSLKEGKYLEMDIPLDQIAVLIRSGQIIFTQKPKLTTKETRKSNFDVIVALDEHGQADGSLYFDDGEDYRIEITKKFNFVNFYVYKNVLFNKIIQSKYEAQPEATSISIIGLNFKVTKVTINGLDVQFTYDPIALKLLINQKIDLKKQFIIVWS